MIVLINDHENNSKHGYVFHYQWGIGRKMLLALMGIHRNLYNCYRYDGSGLLKVAREYNDLAGHLEYSLIFWGGGKLTVKYHDTDETEEKYCTFDKFQEPEEIKKFVNEFCDNNNGVMLVTIDWKSWKEQDMHVGWLSGYEEEYTQNLTPFDKWLSLEDWCNLDINKDYADEKFTKLVRDYMDYFEIEEMASKNKAEEELNIEEVKIEL